MNTPREVWRSIGVFDLPTIETGIEHIVGEFGIGLMIANLLIAVLIWRMRNRVMSEQ